MFTKDEGDNDDICRLLKRLCAIATLSSGAGRHAYPATNSCSLQKFAPAALFPRFIRNSLTPPPLLPSKATEVGRQTHEALTTAAAPPTVRPVPQPRDQHVHKTLISTQSVVCNGYMYKTLAGHNPHSLQPVDEYNRLYPLLHAWQLSPNTPDAVQVCASYPWASYALVFADGSSHFTALAATANLLFRPGWLPSRRHALDGPPAWTRCRSVSQANWLHRTAGERVSWMGSLREEDGRYGSKAYSGCMIFPPPQPKRSQRRTPCCPSAKFQRNYSF